MPIRNLIVDTHQTNTEPLIQGKTIDRYDIRDFKKYIIWKPKKIHRTRPDYLWNADKKIIIRRISGGMRPLFAVLDKNKHKTFASTNNLLLSENTMLDYNFILGLLNSRVLNFYYSHNFSNKSNLTVNISKTYLESLPIPRLDLERQGRQKEPRQNGRASRTNARITKAKTNPNQRIPSRAKQPSTEPSTHWIKI